MPRATPQPAASPPLRCCRIGLTLLLTAAVGCAATRQLSSRLAGGQSTVANAAAPPAVELAGPSPEEPGRFERALQICQASLEEGYLKGSLLWADQAIGMEPDSAKAWAVRSRVHERMGDQDAALNDLLQAQRLAPEDGEIALAVAQHHLTRGDHRSCLTAINQIDCQKASAETASHAHRLAGECYLELDRPHDAADRCRVAIAGGSECPTVASMLTEAEALCGRGAPAPAETPVRVAEQPATSVYR